MYEKVKARVFDGPQIRKLTKDGIFLNSINFIEAAVWNSFVIVVNDFLGNKKAFNYPKVVNNMLKKLGANMCMKLQLSPNAP